MGIGVAVEAILTRGWRRSLVSEVHFLNVAEYSKSRIQVSKDVMILANMDIHMTSHRVQVLLLSLGMVFMQELRHERD